MLTGERCSNQELWSTHLMEEFMGSDQGNTVARSRVLGALSAPAHITDLGMIPVKEA